MRCFIIIFILLIFLNSAFAQDISRRQEAIDLALAKEELKQAQISFKDISLQEKDKLVYAQKIDSYFRHIAESKARRQEGKVGIEEAGIEYAYDFKVLGKLPLCVSFKNDYIGIENTTEVKLPAHLFALTLGLDATFPFFHFEDTYLRLGIRPSFFGDEWDMESSSFRIPSYLVWIRKVNEKFMFLVGVAVSPDFEQEAMPVAGLIYQPNEKLSFNLIPEEPNISYKINEQFTFFAEAGLSSREFEVDKDNLENVVLHYRQARLGTGLKIKINSNIEGSLSTGVVFNRSIKYRDTNLGKVKLDPNLYSQVRLEIKI